MRLINADTDGIDRAAQELYEVLVFLRRLETPGARIAHAEQHQATERLTCAMGRLARAGIPMPAMPEELVQEYRHERR